MPRTEQAASAGLRVATGLGLTVVFLGATFWLAGGIGWLWGWSFLGLSVVIQSAIGVYLRRRDPELLRRRRQVGAGTPRWDAWWLRVFHALYLAIFPVAALDSGRFEWSAMSRGWWLVGAVLYVGFGVLLARTMAVNTHFEKTVRIQSDRDHRVIEAGPYRVVRHPGYAGTIPGFILATPLLLGSWWAFVPAVLTAAWMVLRTVLEDRFLRRELEGYADYALRVRYRLIPGVW